MVFQEILRSAATPSPLPRCPEAKGSVHRRITGCPRVHAGHGQRPQAHRTLQWMCSHVADLSISPSLTHIFQMEKLRPTEGEEAPQGSPRRRWPSRRTHRATVRHRDSQEPHSGKLHGRKQRPERAGQRHPAVSSLGRSEHEHRDMALSRR